MSDLKAKMRQIYDFRWSFAPPCWQAYSAPRSLAVCKDPFSKGREGKGWGGERNGKGRGKRGGRKGRKRGMVEGREGREKCEALGPQGS